VSERQEMGKDGEQMGELADYRTAQQAAILEELERREEAIIGEMVECETKKGRMGLRERWLEVRELRAKFSGGNCAVPSSEMEAVA
jgi:hypothetical protein